MAQQTGEQVSAQILQRMSAELRRVADLAGKGGQAVDLGAVKASEGINQSCNGICGGLAELGRASEVEITRAATAAAVYHVRLYKEIASLGSAAADSINQGCNGICGAGKFNETVSTPASG